MYLVYIIGWALINPKVAPKLPPEQLVVPIPPTIRFLRDNYAHNMLVASFKALFSPAKLMNAPADTRLSFGKIFKNVLAALTPLALVAVTMWGVWWYVIIHQQNERDALNVPVATQVAKASKSVAEPVDLIEQCSAYCLRAWPFLSGSGPAHGTGRFGPPRAYRQHARTPRACHQRFAPSCDSNC